jgi:hypothetical protein
VVGLADLPGQRFIFSLFDADADLDRRPVRPAKPRPDQVPGIGKQPYDALVTPDGRHYIAGLFGEDGLAKIDLWAEPQPGAERILAGYGRGEAAAAGVQDAAPARLGGGRAATPGLPAIGRHEVLVVDTASWQEVARVPVAGQPVFVMARPDGRQVWVNFAVPDYDTVQVIDTQTRQVVRDLEARPRRAAHGVHPARRGGVDQRRDDTACGHRHRSFQTLAELPARSPSGIFFSARAARAGRRHGPGRAPAERRLPARLSAGWPAPSRRHGRGTSARTEDDTLAACAGCRARRHQPRRRRVGARRAGGAALLCAMAVPPPRLEAVAAWCRRTPASTTTTSANMR